MIGTIDIINPSPFWAQLTKGKSDKYFLPQISAKDFRIKAYNTEPLEGFSLPDGFPHCCESHKSLFNDTLDLYHKFPNCCELHQNLLKAPWFNKTDYAYLPIKILLSCTYTKHCFSVSINNENWFKAITDYIEYSFDSFGQMPDGFGCSLGRNRYVHVTKGYIEMHKDIPRQKKTALLSFIQELDASKEDTAGEPIDINKLLGLYKEWLAIFPFEIDFFKKIKAVCEKKIPILKGPVHTNMYTGFSRQQTMTLPEMVESLKSITTLLIKEINSHVLHKQGLLQNPDDIIIEIISAKRELSLKKYDNLSSFTKGYVSILQDWLKDEKEFLEDLIPALNRKKESRQFVDYLIEGLLEMQRQDVNVPAIHALKNGGKKDESGFRFFMKTFLKGGFLKGSLSAEELKGDGRIDLKITDPTLGEKIVEFKGWWNSDKKLVAQQICSYLTDANKEGYIVMINHTDKPIVEDYRTFITAEINTCVAWEEIQYPYTTFSYYKSTHNLSTGTRKELYHLIFNIYSSPIRTK